MNLSGKRVLLTGACGGFGQAIARELLDQGASIIGLDLQPSEMGFEVIGCDVAVDEDVALAVAKACELLGGLDVLINNAGINGFEDPGSRPTDASMRKLNVNFWGTWRVTAAALPDLLRSGGRVINIASVGAYAIMPFLPSYAASKRALAAYSDVLRAMYGDRIKVITAYPCYMRTAIHDSSVTQGFLPELVYATTLGRFTIFTWEEELTDAARGIRRLCDGPAPRDAGVTWRSSLILQGARHVPTVVEWTLRKRIQRMQEAGMRLDLTQPGIADSGRKHYRHE